MGASQGLLYLLKNVAPRSIVLIEDIDATFPISRTQRSDSMDDSVLIHPVGVGHGLDQMVAASSCRVTFSGLLNAIDGESHSLASSI